MIHFGNFKYHLFFNFYFFLARIDSIEVNLSKSSIAVRDQNKLQIITIYNN